MCAQNESLGKVWNDEILGITHHHAWWWVIDTAEEDTTNMDYFSRSPFCSGRKVDNWLPLLTPLLHQYRRGTESPNWKEFLAALCFKLLSRTIYLSAMHFYKTYFVCLIYHSSCASWLCWLCTTILLSYDSGLQFFSTIAFEVLCHSNNRLRCNWRTRVFLQQCRLLAATTSYNFLEQYNFWNTLLDILLQYNICMLCYFLCEVKNDFLKKRFVHSIQQNWKWKMHYSFACCW